MPTISAPHTPDEPPEKGTTRVRRHWWRWVAGVLAVLLALFVGAGWYFSGRIESGALRATPAPDVPAYDDVTVVRVGNVTDRSAWGDSPAMLVTLAKGPDAPDNFDTPAQYSLVWDGGWGSVAPATANPDGTVDRWLSLLDGTAPTPGQLAAQTRSEWPFGSQEGARRFLNTTEVMIGENPAWFEPAQDNSTTSMAIVVHGQNGNRSNGTRFVMPVSDAGMATLIISYRNDHGAPTDPSGLLQYGQTEWRDLDAAVTWAREHGAKNIVLIGESMGGAIVAAFLENSDQADVVSKVVLDAPMLSLAETISYNARDAMPITGGAVPPPVLWAAERITSLRYGIDWSRVNYLDDTSWLRVPTLVIHGTADERVPVSVGRTLKAAAPDLVRLQEFKDAQHTEAYNSDPGRFRATVAQFLGAS